MFTIALVCSAALAAGIGTAIYMNVKNARKEAALYAMEVFVSRSGRVGLSDELIFKNEAELSKFLSTEIEKAQNAPNNPGNLNGVRNVYLVEGPVEILKEIRKNCKSYMDVDKYVEKPPVNTHIYTIK